MGSAEIKMVSGLPLSMFHIMFTLDSTTLYYYFLSDSTSNEEECFSAGINNWAASIPSNVKPTTRNKCSTTGSSMTRGGTSSGPPLTNASTRLSTSSVLSKNVKITTNVEPTNIGIQVIDGALSDEDETMGFEREAAVMSPPKGKRRATSAVGNISSLSVQMQLIYI
jgi:hypothetical protein